MKNKKFLYVILVVALAFCITTAVMVPSAVAEASDEFKADSELKIAHITDLHYYPLNYCYPGEGTEFFAKISSNPKLLLESQLINVQAIRDLKDVDAQYVVVTGDLTLNGEMQGHYELANMLRQVQNEIRANGKPNFQIFVTPGNHDMYNDEAYRYDIDGSTDVAPTITRYDLTMMYAGLGFENQDEAALDSYYASIEDKLVKTNLPFDADAGKLYVSSNNSDDVTFARQAELDGRADYENSELSYIAYCPDDVTIIAIDEEISNDEVFHHVGGKIYKTTENWLTSMKSTFKDDFLVGICHHNVVPHFDLEDTLLMDFTVYSWTESADFLADLGVRFMFTGHMHANDVVSHISFNGNHLTDTQTASLTGYRAAIRLAKLEQGSVGSDYAVNYTSELIPVSNVDMSALVNRGFVTEKYFEDHKVTPYMDGLTCVDVSEYNGTRLFRNIVDNLIGQYLTVDFIGGLGSMVSGILPEMLEGVAPLAETLVNNIIDHVESTALKDYEYTGDNEDYKQDVTGAKLCGYAYELVDRLINMDVSGTGLTLFDFAMGGYLSHVGGVDRLPEDTPEEIYLALENFKNGSVVKTLIDNFLFEDRALLPVIMCLIEEPINLTKGMTKQEASSVETIFTLIAPKGYTVDTSAIMLEDYVPGILDLLNGLMDLGIEIEGSVSDFLMGVIDSYITESMYTGLGEIAYDILYQFYIDESPDGDYDVETLHLPYDYLEVTYLEGAVKSEATQENGKLPRMLTVNFGEDTTTDKNFTWFTDRRVTDTQIQYVEGTEFDEDDAEIVNGDSKVYLTSTASIDLGVFATLMPIEVGRHSVELTGLKPNTVYSYRVGSPSKDWWSEVYTFKTAPADNQAFEVLLLSDLQGYARDTYHKVNKVLENVDKVFENGYDFVINCGDVVDNSRNLVQWDAFLNIPGKYWGNTTQVVAVGNHGKYSFEKSEDDGFFMSGVEVVDNEYNYVLMHYNFSYPEQDDTTGAYYSFDYSGVHFTVLNTNDIDADTNGLSDAQLEWLKEDLKNTTKQYKVVLMHKGAYSSGAHVKDADVKAIREQVTSIFADNGVALVLQGHDHTYSESYFIDRDGNAVDMAKSKDGAIELGTGAVLYVTLGTMGDKFYDFVEDENVPLEFGKDLHDTTLLNPTFGKLTYDGEKLYYVGYECDLETGEISPLRAENDPTKYIAYGILGASLLSFIWILVVNVKRARIRKAK